MARNEKNAGFPWVLWSDRTTMPRVFHSTATPSGNTQVAIDRCNNGAAWNRTKKCSIVLIIKLRNRNCA